MTEANPSVPMREYLPARLRELQEQQLRIAGCIAEVQRMMQIIAPPETTETITRTNGAVPRKRK